MSWRDITLSDVTDAFTGGLLAFTYYLAACVVVLIIYVAWKKRHLIKRI